MFWHLKIVKKNVGLRNSPFPSGCLYFVYSLSPPTTIWLFEYLLYYCFPYYYLFFHSPVVSFVASLSVATFGWLIVYLFAGIFYGLFTFLWLVPVIYSFLTVEFLFYGPWVTKPEEGQEESEKE